jgi:hypothetical protein
MQGIKVLVMSMKVHLIWNRCHLEKARGIGNKEQLKVEQY